MIYIEVLNIRWEPGRFGFPDLSEMQRAKFENWLGEEFVRQIKVSVSLQRYRNQWAPLSVRYLVWKRENNLSLKTWEASGELISNLSYNKRTKKIGFDKRYRHSGSGESYLSIARTLEYGNLQTPPRPLFREVYYYMSKNIKYFYLRYKKEVSR